jgi:LysB family phage lysis regulatory protein
MNALALKLAGGVIVLSMIAGGVLYMRELRAELASANQQLDVARQGIADRDNTIKQLKQDADDKAKQQAQLDTSKGKVAATLVANQQEHRRVINETPDARAWADTPLPDGIVRLQSTPNLTGADDYSARMPAGDALHAASDGAAH